MTLEIVAWHDRTLIDHVQNEHSNQAQGFRTLSLCVYGERNDPRYAAVMIRRQLSVSQIQFDSLNLDSWQQTCNDMAAKGFGPVIVTATGPPNDPVIAAIFELMSPIPLIQVGITREEMNRTINEMIAPTSGRPIRRILQWADSYGTPEDTRYIAVFRQNRDNIAWSCEGIDDDDSKAQERFIALTSVQARPFHVALTPSQRFLEMYVDNQDGRFDYKVGLTSEQYQNEFNNHMGQGLVPMRVAAQGTGADTTFAAIFAESEDTQPRHFHTIGPSSVPEIDNAIEDIMRKTGTRGAALAIVEDTRLVYVKGYTFAEDNYPIVQPTTIFRQASVSKVITALATYQLIMENKLDLEDKMQDILQLRTPDGQEPTDRRFECITIQDLLEYRSGLDPALLGRDEEAVNKFNTQLPAIPVQLASLAASLPLIVSPGKMPGEDDLHGVANSGYFMLSQVIKKLRNVDDFAQALGPTLQPLGITRIRKARAPLSAQPPDGARYQAFYLATDKNLMAPAHTSGVVPLGYGDKSFTENYEGSGGLSAPVTDIARILASLSLSGGNPALNQSTLASWLRNASTATNKHRNAHGFDEVVHNPDGSFRGHKGGLLSTSSNGVNFTTGRISFVICWNWQAPRNIYLSSGAEDWYPNFPSVIRASNPPRNWGHVDLFPQFGMPPF